MFINKYLAHDSDVQQQIISIDNKIYSELISHYLLTFSVQHGFVLTGRKI